MRQIKIQECMINMTVDRSNIFGGNANAGGLAEQVQAVYC